MNGIEIGEVVSFKPEAFKIEVQGRVMGYVEEDGVLYAQIYLLARGTKDYVTANSKIYHYYDTDYFAYINVDQITKAIPSVIMTPADDGKQFLIEHFPLKLRQNGVIYVTEYQDESGHRQLVEPVLLQLMWFHFSPLEVESYYDLVIDPSDLSTGMLCSLKALFFDMFVSPLSPSKRRNQISWNQKSWRIILEAAKGGITPGSCYEQITKLVKSGTELFYCPHICIPLILCVMDQWLHIDQNMNLYEAGDYMRYHEKCLKSILKKCGSIITRQAHSKKEEELYEEEEKHLLELQEKGLEEEEENESYITDDKSLSTVSLSSSEEEDASTGDESGTSLNSDSDSEGECLSDSDKSEWE